MVLALELLLFDMDVVPFERHAIKRLRSAALTWLLVYQPMLCLLINTIAAAIVAWCAQPHSSLPCCKQFTGPRSPR
jgi:hypothetical protein